MIQLEYNEKQWIKLCKGHLKDKYPPRSRWVETLKPLFTEFYGWNPDEDRNYQDYLNCIFNRLLDIYLKIADDKSGNNNQMRGIFSAAFYKSVSRMDELPIERAISELCGLIAFNTVIDENKEQRYEL
jgi:hypothetical protein